MHLKKIAPQLSIVAKKEVSVSVFIPYTCHYSPRTLLTKDGDLLQIIQLDGLPFETLDADSIDGRKQILNTVLKNFNSNYACWFHTIRRKHFEYPTHVYPEGFAADLDDAWQQQLAKRSLYVNELYITVVRKQSSNKIKKWSERLASFSHQHNQESQSVALAKAEQELTEAADQLVSNLNAYGARMLTAQGSYSNTLSFVSGLLNLETRPVLLPTMDIADYLPSKRLLFGKDTLEVRGTTQSQYAAMLGIKQYCAQTHTGLLDKLLKLPCEFILTQSFAFHDRPTVLALMQRQQRVLRQTEQYAVSQTEQIDTALDAVTSGDVGFGDHHLSLLVIGNSTDQLQEAISMTQTELVNTGIVAVREDINLEAAFWAQLPGNFKFIARKAPISTMNLAGIVSLHNFPQGKAQNNHWGPAVTVLETTSGTPYFFNFHQNDVGHTTVIGPTGSGKTVAMTFLLAQSMKFGGRCIYFDKDRGAEIAIRALGGVYSEIKAGQPSGFNPLQLADNLANRAFLLEWLKQLVKAESAEEMATLQQAVSGLYKLDSAARTLTNLALFLGMATPGSLRNRLEPWLKDNSHGYLFDNPTDSLNLDQAVLGFEMGHVLDDSAGRTPVLMYLFHRINQLLDGSPTIIVLDEGWKALDDPVFVTTLKDWLKTLRKRNALVVFGTQSAEDAANSQIADTLLQQTATHLFFPNLKAQTWAYRERFGLSQKEFEWIKNQPSNSRCFLIKQGKYSVIAKLDMTGMQHELDILSGRAQSLKKLDALRQESPEQWLQEWRKTA